MCLFDKFVDFFNTNAIKYPGKTSLKFNIVDTLNQKRVWIYQPSLGAGFKIKNATIDYAFTNLANQSSPLYTHVFSLKFNLIKKNEN